MKTLFFSRPTNLFEAERRFKSAQYECSAGGEILKTRKKIFDCEKTA
jgi:hypothetical protein